MEIIDGRLSISNFAVPEWLLGELLNFNFLIRDSGDNLHINIKIPEFIHRLGQAIGYTQDDSNTLQSIILHLTNIRDEWYTKLNINNTSSENTFFTSKYSRELYIKPSRNVLHTLLTFVRWESYEYQPSGLIFNNSNFCLPQTNSSLIPLQGLILLNKNKPESFYVKSSRDIDRDLELRTYG